MKKLAEILNYYNYEKLSEYHKYENDFVNNIITSIIDNVKTNTGSGLYNVDTPITIEAIPDIGYNFVKWSDGN